MRHGSIAYHKTQQQIVRGMRSLAIVVVWTIWKERNARIFEQKETAMMQLIAKAKEEASMWATAGAKHLTAVIVTNISE